MTTPTPAQIEAAAKALCKSWPKDPNGCAALCMDRLGSIPKEGCRHAVAVHGERVSAALAAAAQAGERTGQEASDDATSSLDFLAAQVGEPRQEGMAWIIHETKLRTIERCRQVVKEEGERWGIPVHRIISALDRLKDEP